LGRGSAGGMNVGRREHPEVKGSRCKSRWDSREDWLAKRPGELRTSVATCAVRLNWSAPKRKKKDPGNSSFSDVRIVGGDQKKVKPQI